MFEFVVYLLLDSFLVSIFSFSGLMLGHLFDQPKNNLGLFGDIYSTIGLIVGSLFGLFIVYLY